MQTRKKLLAKVFEKLGMEPPHPDWVGIDPVLSILERIREDGAVVVIKLDGERKSPGDSGPYSVSVLGAPLAGESIRADTQSLEDSLTRVILGYADRFWK
ncbi:hypothetical protein [Corallococcus interemptor]|uniref:hypothetical protein n=1 Tax=Corallococcus interemptor TaxID=2316720 RepID=UPI001315725E|nr:hypothetical protein [Corallococcus interemptor]